MIFMCQTTSSVTQQVLSVLIITLLFVPIDCWSIAPRIEIGEVDLDMYPTCEQQLAPYRHKCEAQYRTSVIETLRSHNNDIRTESVRRATCCGIWRARQCVTEAALSIKDCGPHVAAMYANLPTDRYTKEEVADKCTEYDESAPICKNCGISLVTTIWQLLFVIVLRFIID